MTFLEKSLFNFYDIITRFIINDFETNRNENTMSKKSTEMKITKKTKPFRGQKSVSNTSTRLQLSAVIQTNRTGITVCKLVET